MSNSASMSEKAGLSEKLALGGAQFASCFLPAFLAYHLMWFCTDVALLPPSATCFLMILPRLVGACYDSVLGLFMNRMQFKDGKYRPYFKWCAIPFAISLSLLCFMPTSSLTGKIAFIAVMLLASEFFGAAMVTATYSMIPYVAKSDVDRTKFVSFCVACGILSFIVVGSFFLPMVNYLGNGDKGTGMPLTLALFSLISIPLHFNAYFFLRERHYSVPTTKPTLRDLVTTIAQNRRLMLFFAGYGIYSMANGFKSQTTYYYVTYNLGLPKLLPFVIFAGLVAPLVMQPVIPRLLALARKETLIAIGLFGASASSCLMLLVGRHPVALIACVVLYGLFTAMTANLAFALMASFSDEIKERNNFQMSDILSATMRFGDRVGIAVAGGIGALVLGICGYVAPATGQAVVELATEQSATSLAGIKALYIHCTAAGLIVAGLTMLKLRNSGRC